MQFVHSKVPGCSTGIRIFALLACGYCGSGVRARTAVESIVSICCDERSGCPIDLNSSSFSCPAIPIPNTAIYLHGLVVGIWRRSLVPYEFPDGNIVHPEPASAIHTFRRCENKKRKENINLWTFRIWTRSQVNWQYLLDNVLVPLKSVFVECRGWVEREPVLDLPSSRAVNEDIGMEDIRLPWSIS